jgi:hypothetical protein
VFCIGSEGLDAFKATEDDLAESLTKSNWDPVLRISNEFFLDFHRRQQSFGQRTRPRFHEIARFDIVDFIPGSINIDEGPPHCNLKQAHAE